MGGWGGRAGRAGGVGGVRAWGRDYGVYAYFHSAETPRSF